MAEFRIPLSEIIELAKTQAYQYYLECHTKETDMSKNRWDRFKADKEMRY